MSPCTPVLRLLGAPVEGSSKEKAMRLSWHGVGVGVGDGVGVGVSVGVAVAVGVGVGVRVAVGVGSGSVIPYSTFRK